MYEIHLGRETAVPENFEWGGTTEGTLSRAQKILGIIFLD
jgi:hypothetical protein